GGRVGPPDARPQQSHVVVDLRNGADRRTWIFRGGLLFDRNCRRQSIDLVDVRLLHHLEELPRVSRERLHVAALALGINGVEGERGFARAGEAGEHDQPVARDRDVDILEIVLARAADGYLAGVAEGVAGAFGHGIRSTEERDVSGKLTPPARQKDAGAVRACWSERSKNNYPLPAQARNRS